MLALIIVTGGGRAQVAQAGGKDAAKLHEALDLARAFALKAVPH